MKEEIYFDNQTEEPFCIDVPYLPLRRKHKRQQEQDGEPQQWLNDNLPL